MTAITLTGDGLIIMPRPLVSQVQPMRNMALAVLDSKRQEWHDVRTVILFVDNRTLQGTGSPTYWQDFAPWIRERCRWTGSYGEITAASYIQGNTSNGLGKIRYTWAGIFVLEAAAFLYPTINFILSGADCIPLSLYEVEELVRIAASLFLNDFTTWLRAQCY